MQTIFPFGAMQGAQPVNLMRLRPTSLTGRAAGRARQRKVIDNHRIAIFRLCSMLTVLHRLRSWREFGVPQESTARSQRQFRLVKGLATCAVLVLVYYRQSGECPTRQFGLGSGLPSKSRPLPSSLASERLGNVCARSETARQQTTCSPSCSIGAPIHQGHARHSAVAGGNQPWMLARASINGI
jgi:hypothetical protein